MVILNLNGKWRMKKTTGNEWIQSNVPGSVYGDLLTTGMIKDPFYRDNELQIKELSRYDYEYKREFIINSELFDSDRIILRCEGLDTLAEIIINDKPVAETCNMHRIYEFDIKKFLIKGENSIHLIFRSPLEYIKKKNNESPLWNPEPSEPGIAHLRKSHYMFGWDWGPVLPDIGIWRDISIRGYNIARITDVYTTQEHKDKEVLIDIGIKQDRWTDNQTEIIVNIQTPDREKINRNVPVSGNEEHIRINIHNPGLWWPNGYGDQPLYEVEVILTADNIILDSRSFKIGLRTITVKQEKDEWGRSFEFEVNGISIFAMGANYIPEDNLLSRCSRQKTKKLIKACAAANFNCIRIWGGGIYPEDYFFDLCDKYGLIVWHDLMFACAVYEMTDEFANNIKKEAEDNIRRIRHHACIGLWCGNNEMEWAWVEWKLPGNDKLKNDYVKQFEELLPATVKETDPAAFYWPASPSSGGGFDKPNDENIGDVHDWIVWHGRQPITHYRNHYYRFLSEFGLQSFPSLKTVKSFTLPEDRNIFSHVMEHHQKNRTGNEIILYYISQYFKYPGKLSSLLYASQLIQAEGVKYAVEHMRRNRGRCMGSIYWQLNDCWPVASWSSIDSSGRWKALHYYARRFYQPVLLSACENGLKVKLHITNDSLQDITGNIKWALRDSYSGIIQEGTKDVTIEALSTKPCEELDFSEILDTIEKQRSIYLEYYLIIDTNSISPGVLLFVRTKHFTFQNPGITFNIYRKENKKIISLKSKAFAGYVEVDFEDMDAVFSDNYFHLSAGTVKEIEIIKDSLPENIPLKKLKKKLKIRSVYNIEEQNE